ncbi:hypothetical protein SAMN05660420_03365 [Desulfuromusa kysingii]|uniref:Uncharacterized protein n=1 Tax=Desulfuromusa kysingii TaxID=37625 RepID=A0A1H4EFL3_9BACT|nr:hypothetical protein [Desulfuromusa kysingii]SEA83851.1 hypothetical protein SAMN05660420_03365 [Desulfuromusa kysingii]
MINIGSTDFYMPVPSLPREEFEQYATQLFDDWESYASGVLKLDDYSLSLNVQEGSIKALGTIGVYLGILYFGIGNYGSFITGLQTIRGQVNTVNEYFSDRASDPFKLSHLNPKVKKYGGALASIENLFLKVKKGEITVEEAMKRSEIILGDEAESVPEFMHDLQGALEKTPLLPTQTLLPFKESEILLLPQKIKNKKKTSPASPRQPLPNPDQYRVEVWRDNRKGKRHVKVISL